MARWCTVCGKITNPIILVRVGNKTFYLCHKHALEFKDELDNQILALNSLHNYLEWAKKEGYE